MVKDLSLSLLCFFVALSGSNVFEVIIPESNEGLTVTIGLSFE